MVVLFGIKVRAIRLGIYINGDSTRFIDVKILILGLWRVLALKSDGTWMHGGANLMVN